MTWLLLVHLAFEGLAPGVQGEGEVGANREGEVEDLALADQRLAEGQTLGGHGVFSTSSGAHFWSLLLNHEFRKLDQKNSQINFGTNKVRL